MHTVLAHLGGPHWIMSEEDATNYARAVNNVARHYDVGAAQKTIDIANLVGLIAFYEGTRILYQRTQAGRQQPPPRPRGQVVPIFQFAPPFSPAAEATPAPTPPDAGTAPLAEPPEGAVH
jgi:hypothetical protein